MPLTIHPELQSLIPPLTPEELAQLEANILRDGCHDPLIVWQEEQTLLDGHNRYAICTRHGLAYTTLELSLASLDAAKAWMVANQLGRRNLTPKQMSYLRGKHYELQKRQGQRTDLTSDQNDTKLHTTAAQLAQQYKVSAPTIKRDAAYARAVDAIATAVGPEARQTLLARDAKVTQEGVKQLADLATSEPQTVRHVLEAVKAARTPKAAKAVLAHAVVAPACGICHRPLTDPDSQAIGPICACQKPSTSFASGPGAAGVIQPSLEGLLQEALRSVGALYEWLAGAVLPDALDSHADMGVQLGQACQRLLEQLSTVPAILEAVFGKPTPAVRPTPGKDANTKQCRQGHTPYEAGRKECPECVSTRKRRQRQRAKALATESMS